MSSIPTSPSNSIFYKLDYKSRMYLHHFARSVCQDLVLYDTVNENCFRELVPMAHENELLLQIIVANAALHMSNVGSKHGHIDALTAKQKALVLLRRALSEPTSNLDTILATILLLIEFELIDNQQGSWKHHMKGVREFVHRLTRSAIDMSPLRRQIVGNILMFDIVGGSTANVLPSTNFSPGALELLHDAEGNLCASFPIKLLLLIQDGTRIHENTSNLDERHEQAIPLLETVKAFDPRTWAERLQPRSPSRDVAQREHLATAHQAAVRIFLLNVAFGSRKPAQEHLVDMIITSLKHIRADDVLFTATTWPSFIAGAETTASTSQGWATNHLDELWRVEPWGVNRQALTLLESIWREREHSSQGHDWLTNLRSSGTNMLVL